MLCSARRCVILCLVLVGLESSSARVVAAEPDKEAAERGYRLLLTAPFEAPFMTEKEYVDLWKFWPEPLRGQAEKATPEQRRQMALFRYGFQESADRPGPFPLQFTSDGKGNLSFNCLACHSGTVKGKVIRGLGNSLLHAATFEEDLTRLRDAAGLKAPASPADLPPAPAAKVRGLNNAWGGATLFQAVRDKDLNRVDVLQYPRPTPENLDIPLKTPPWWLSRKKRATTMTVSSASRTATLCSLRSATRHCASRSLTGRIPSRTSTPSSTRSNRPNTPGRLTRTWRRKV